MIDSIYTDPEKLRLQYLNPLNPTREIDGLAQSQIETPVVQNPITPATDIPLPDRHCPHKLDFVVSRAANGSPLPILAVKVKAFETYLHNPLTGNFNLVIHAEIIKRVRCFEVTTKNGARGIFSESHPILTAELDKFGTTVVDLRERDWILTQIDGEFLPMSQIEKIVLIGLRDVVHITLETEHIFASGRRPLQMIVGHNKALPTQDQFPEVP